VSLGRFARLPGDSLFRFTAGPKREKKIFAAEIQKNGKFQP